MPYGVFDPLGPVASNVGFLFDGRTVNGEVVSCVMVPALGHIGLTFEIQASKSGDLKIEEFRSPDTNPFDGYQDGEFVQFEPTIAVTASVAKKQDYSSTFRPFRVRFTPGTPGDYTLLLNAASKSR